MYKKSKEGDNHVTLMVQLYNKQDHQQESVDRPNIQIPSTCPKDLQGNFHWTSCTATVRNKIVSITPEENDPNLCIQA